MPTCIILRGKDGSDRAYLGRLSGREIDLALVDVSSRSRLDECLLLVRFLVLVAFVWRQALQLRVDGVVDVVVGVAGGDVERRQHCTNERQNHRTRHTVNQRPTND